MKYTVESIEHVATDWGGVFVANIRIQNDVVLYRIGPAYSVAELVQLILNRFGE